MKAKSPVVEGLEQNEVILAKDQPEYEPLPALLGGAPLLRVVLTRWEFSEEERIAIEAGQDLFLTTLTFGKPFHPIRFSVGKPEPCIFYDNNKDLFDEACGDVVRAWATAITSVSALATDVEQQRAAMTRHLLGALHALVGSTMVEEVKGVILEG